MLRLEKISAGYGSMIIIKDISLQFEPGKIYAILGKNGCGKSTLLKTCADMLTPECGDIFLNAKNLKGYQPIERARQISYLSQHRNTPNISVERLLMHGRHPHMSHLKQMRKEDWDKLEEVIELMEISEFRHHALSELSGGERQRVYLAMLLAQDTPVMLLDEPTTYMDIAYQLSFLELIKNLKARRKCIILVLHDLNQAMQVADQIVLMENGKIFMQGTPAEIIDQHGLEQVFQVQLATYEKGENIMFHMTLNK